MWILPNNKIIKNPSTTKVFTINEINHPEVNLLYWDNDFLASLNIKRFVEVKYDSRTHRSINFTDVELDGVVTRTHTLELRPIRLLTSEDLVLKRISKNKETHEKALENQAIAELKFEGLIPSNFERRPDGLS